MKEIVRIFVVVLLFVSGGIVHAVDLYVSPAGSDQNPGTKDQPLATLAAAVKKVRPLTGKEAVTVYFADGVYYLPETVTFTPEDSGSEKNPVLYTAQKEGGAVLSGGSTLDLQWKPYQEGIFQAKTPVGLEIDQLFINGKNQRMARYPNFDSSKKTDAYQGYAADAFSKERAAKWSDPTGGYIHAMHRSQWGGYHYRITGKDAKGEVTYEGGWQNNRQMGMHRDYRMVENIFEELDAAGEWYHNAKSNTLFYIPEPGIDLSKAVVEVVRLRHLVEFQGLEKSPVKFITLQGFVVRHAARTFMDCKEPLLRSDWTIYRGGAFLLTGTEDIKILDSEFDQVGGNAIFVSNYNRRTLVKGCHIHDAGASGVCFVGDPDAVRNPCFEYGQRNEFSEISKTVGPKTKNYPSLGVVEDCLIHGIGRVERQPAGVQMSMSQDITVRDCSVYDCARAGINISEGTWGGHLIERCDVFDTVLETHDHGSFNSWGRDRYWHCASPDDLAADPTLPFLDAMKTTVIRNSRWRCDHGWDIDLDDGSSNYDIYNNLMLARGLKLREGFRRHAWNNIAVNGGLHPHVWYEGSKDQVTSNIFMSPHRPARMKTPYTNGTRVDENLYGATESAVMNVSQKLGWDQNSIFGDPMFVDPAKGDFRVKEGSPALKIGFKNFPMDQFGVKKPSLKAIARTPEFLVPAAVQSNQAGEAAQDRTWLGATISDLSGEDFSAYGVSKEDGGVALSGIRKNSPAAKAGFLNGDLIQAVNGRKTVNVRQFNRFIGRVQGTVTVKLVCNQQVIEHEVLPGIATAKTDATADRMQWFQDAKFGMFIHFGVERKSEFNPVDFDAGQWVRIAKEGGMKYIVLTTKHHAGFCLWDSALTEWNVVDQTPFKRDIVKELAEACKAEGIQMGCYYSIADYHHPLYEPKYQNRPQRRIGTVPGADITKYIDYMFGQLEELCELYHPCLIWFDGGSGFRHPDNKPLLRRQELVDMLHSYGTLANSRLGDDDPLLIADYLNMNDNLAPAFNLGVYFESAVTMGDSWHYRGNEELKSPQALLERLVNAAGNGGNLLLNVGPDHDGVIPKAMETRIKTMGDWLKKNGEAIYGTEAGPYPYEISWGTITQRKNEDNTSLYLNVVDWPKDGKFTLFGVNNNVLNASLLATGEAIKHETKVDASSGHKIITLEVPNSAPDEYVSVIKLVVTGAVSMDETFLQLGDGKVVMGTYNAKIHDLEAVPNKPAKAIDMKMYTVPARGEGIMPARGLTLTGFQTKGQALSWDFRVYEPGPYEVVVVCHAGRNQTWNLQGRMRANVAGQSVENKLIEDKRVTIATMDPGVVDLHSILGTVEINSPGAHTLTLEIASDFTGTKPKVRSVMLVPVSQDD